MNEIGSIPVELDLISIDGYAGYAAGTNGTDEVIASRALHEILWPVMHPHQRALLVSGVFGCTNLSYMPLEQQESQIVEKKDAYE